MQYSFDYLTALALNFAINPSGAVASTISPGASLVDVMSVVAQNSRKNTCME